MEEVDFYLIRHGEKYYKNGGSSTYQLDSPIKADQENVILNTLNEAYCRGMKIDRIISSPFLRTRQTAQIVSNFYNGIPVEIDLRIGEYLGNQRKSSYKYPFTKETYNFNPYWDKNLYSYKNRINSFWKERDKTCKVIYVTHGLGVKTILENYGVDYYPDEGHGVACQNGIFTMF